MSGAIIPYEQHDGSLVQWRDPEKVLAEATAAAQALGRVIALKKDPVVFNDEQYLEFEDWQTVAKFYGITAKATETRYVEYGGIAGWEAVGVAINQQGIEVGRAESMCMTDEDNWGAVPVYEWKDRVDADGKKIWNQGLRKGKGGYEADREKTGEKAKPMFQLRSMAQTRACAKALRQVLAWVVVLGGFKPNVAEEMIESQLGPDGGHRQDRVPVKQPQRASETKKAVAELETISGVMDSVLLNAEKTSVWIKIGENLLVAEEKAGNIREEMANGNYLSVKAKKFNSEKIGDYYKIIEVLKCESVQDAETGESEGDEGQTGLLGFEAEMGKAQASAVEGNAVVDELVANGTVKKASEIPAHDPSVIGIKRAQRLHVLITQNHRTTGFTEEELKKIQVNLKLEHLRDLPVAMYATLEAYATGEKDWRG